MIVQMMKCHESSQGNFDSFCGCNENNSKCKMDSVACNCGEEHEIYEWVWDNRDLNKSASLSSCNRDVLFHQTFSSGTAAVRGGAPFKPNYHYYWEIKMLTTLYGTDVMVGVGTDKVDINLWPYRFCSLLGLDSESWGYSYRGDVQHNGNKHEYGPRFGHGSIIGCHLDMCSGTLEYYHNRRPLGVAFTGLKGHRLYPMVCSTAAQSSMRITCSLSILPTLQLLAIQRLIDDSCLYDLIDTIPGLRNMLSKHFWWLLTEDKQHEIKTTKASSTGLMMVVIDDEEDDTSDVRTVRKRKRETATSSSSPPVCGRLTDGPTSTSHLQINPNQMIFAPCESCGIVRAIGTTKSSRINKNRVCLYCDGLL